MAGIINDQKFLHPPSNPTVARYAPINTGLYNIQKPLVRTGQFNANINSEKKKVFQTSHIISSGVYCNNFKEGTRVWNYIKPTIQNNGIYTSVQNMIITIIPIPITPYN